MTAILGIKEGSRVVMASDGISTTGLFMDSFGNQKVNRVNGMAKSLFAITGTRVEMNVLKGISFIKEDEDTIDFHTLVNVIVPRLFVLGKKYGFSSHDKDGAQQFLGEILLAVPKGLFRINYYGVVVDVGDYCALGSGGNAAATSLYLSEKQPISIEKRAALAIQAAIDTTPGLGFPIYIGENDGSEIRVYHDKNELKSIL